MKPSQREAYAQGEMFFDVAHRLVTVMLVQIDRLTSLAWASEEKSLHNFYLKALEAVIRFDRKIDALGKEFQNYKAE